MKRLSPGLVYPIFFMSGAAALIYEVAWVRSLSLVFGGSHLAVTTVLSVFMGGLALGSYSIGKYVDRSRNLLGLYGLLELGIALFALLFILLMKVYPAIYVFLARGHEESRFYLTFIRAVFAVLSLIVPTTLMGGTLPALTRFVSRGSGRFGTRLSLLYGFNTFGAVAGAVSAGFVFLRFYSLSTTLWIAMTMSVAVGLSAIFLQGRTAAWEPLETEGAAKASRSVLDRVPGEPQAGLVLWGIGLSGFCALGYEVLWTRILTLVVGASVYGFTIMLAAFLTGIALGSEAYSPFMKVLRAREDDLSRPVLGFGLSQLVIGATALLVTFFIRDLPDASLHLRNFLDKLSAADNAGAKVFEMRQWSNLAIAFCYMVVPAFFMGLSFPLAGKVYASRERVGAAVGKVLTYNTVGAILGAFVSGYVLMFLFSIERSLQILTLLNVGLGLVVIVSLWGARLLMWGAAGLTVAAVAFMALNPGALRIWNMKYFAIFRSNQPEAFRANMVKEALENTDVLYYGEGVEAIVSAIKVKGGHQAFITNGRVEASDNLEDQQVQYTLGHLPMLLDKHPRNVLVVGLGSGMTLGATSVHPEARKVTLVELEPKMLGVARTFGRYNHDVLDDPKLHIVFNDGRNFLLTTDEKFDVITADPIHPWFRGAGYLYTAEYFKLASEHLDEGGVMCQWLPIYELTLEDLKSIVNTFTTQFRYTMLWLTHYDSVMVGSNSPIVLDEAALDRRIAAVPAIAQSLDRVHMGSGADLLSYFAMGTKGMRAFGRGGVINTDDNLYLEFSAPLNIGVDFVMERNVFAIARYRESVLPYLAPAKDPAAREAQVKKWSSREEVVGLYDRAHALFLGGAFYTPEFRYLMGELDGKYSFYAPGRFLKEKYAAELAMEPRLIEKRSFVFADRQGGTRVVDIAAVLSPVSDQMAIVHFVNNTARSIYGYLGVPGRDRDEFIGHVVSDIMGGVQAVYLEQARKAASRGMSHPPLKLTLAKMRKAIADGVRKYKAGGNGSKWQGLAQ